VGPDLHDPQYSEVSQDLFWIEWQFPVQSVTGAAQRSDGSTQQSTEVAADQNPFSLLPPSSRMNREKGLQMLNLGRAPSRRRYGEADGYLANLCHEPAVHFIAPGILHLHAMAYLEQLGPQAARFETGGCADRREIFVVIEQESLRFTA